VVKDMAGNFLAPVEVKLTVLPTSATANKSEEEWGSEIGNVKTYAQICLQFSGLNEVSQQ
jgi:hypothetical protein